MGIGFLTRLRALRGGSPEEQARAAELTDEVRSLIVQKQSLSAQPRLGNKLVPRIMAVRNELARSPDGRRALSSLMSDPIEPVRLAGAAWSLPWDKKRAIRVLKRVARESSTLDAVTAKYTLKGYLDGTWVPDWYEPEQASQERPSSPESPSTTLRLDAAFSVNSLVMNGGLDHAFGVVGDTFPSAAEGFRQVGRSDIADLLDAVVGYVAPRGIPDSPEAREKLLEGLGDAEREKVQALVDAYDTADDPQADIEGAA